MKKITIIQIISSVLCSAILALTSFILYCVGTNGQLSLVLNPRHLLPLLRNFLPLLSSVGVPVMLLLCVSKLDGIPIEATPNKRYSILVLGAITVLFFVIQLVGNAVVLGEMIFVAKSPLAAASTAKNLSFVLYEINISLLVMRIAHKVFNIYFPKYS